MQITLQISDLRQNQLPNALVVLFVDYNRSVGVCRRTPAHFTELCIKSMFIGLVVIFYIEQLQ